MNSMLPAAPLPQVYEAARQALVTCEQIDECKQWADKSAALASYAKQAEDETLMNHARRIQLRAVRRMGELIEAVEPGKNQYAGGGGPTGTRREFAEDAGLSKDQQVTAQRVARVPEGEFEAQVESEAPPTVTAVAEQGKKPHVANNSGNNEWYTPSEFIEAARRAMGGIDFDPASSDEAQKRVQAGRYMTAEDDSLRPDADWRAARAWMNPPYASGLIDRFIERLVQAYSEGEIEQAIVLVNNATDTQWFHQLTEHSSALCLPKGRVKFHRPGGQTGAPLQGQAIVYFGFRAPHFENEFCQFGRVWI